MMIGRDEDDPKEKALWAQEYKKNDPAPLMYWHWRLGHKSFKKIVADVDAKKTPWIKLTDRLMEECESCR